jgi:hypothetical protein
VTNCHGAVNEQPNAMRAYKVVKKSLWLACRMVLSSSLFAAAPQVVFAVTKLEQTFTPYVGSSHAYDSNILRSSGLSADKAKDKTVVDSFIHQIRAGLNVDLRHSRQQLIIKGEVNHTWYTNIDGLDYLGHDVFTQWNWVVGSRLKGEVGYGNSLTLASFSQLGQGQRQDQTVKDNYLTDERYFANGEYQLLPDVYFKAGFLRTEWLYAGERQQADLVQNNGEIGVQYRNRNKAMIGFRVVLTDGTYTHRSVPKPSSSDGDNAYFRTTYNLDWEWKHSDKLRLGGLVGYIDQAYQHLSGLNFSDVIARVDVNWAPSDKTALALAAWQQVDQAYTKNATFVLSQGASIKPMWLPTHKIRVEMPLSFMKQDYLGDPPGATGDVRRSDDVVDLGLNIVYSPWVNTEFALKFTHESRSSNATVPITIGKDTKELHLNNYDAETVGISAKVEF